MPNQDPEDVTLDTLHEDLKSGFADLTGEVGGNFTDLKATLVAGFGNLPTRESSEEMVRLLRERIRILAARPPQLDALDACIREQALELQQVLRALAEEKRRFEDRDDGVANR
jgi:hypothetical protein